MTQHRIRSVDRRQTWKSRNGVLGGALAATALLAAFGCGETTSLGDSRSTEDGGATGGAGGSMPSGGASGASSGGAPGASSGGASGASSGGASGASSGGASGASSGGTSGASSGGSAGSVGNDAGLPCILPKPAPVPNPTPDEQSRASLIHDFCVTLVRDNCLDILGGSSFVSEQTTGCSDDERITGCEQDRLYEYFQSIVPECDDEWRAAIICGAGAQYSFLDCETAALGDNGPGRQEPCETEGHALDDCIDTNYPPHEVTGSRATCNFGLGTVSSCEVGCMDGENSFGANCGGPPGLPLRCVCSVNGHSLGDLDFIQTDVFYASDCNEAAQRIADGECIDRLDCCFEYFDGATQRCMCGSDPRLMNQPSCDALAQSVGGNVVAICPQYGPPDPGGGCWPPPCAP